MKSEMKNQKSKYFYMKWGGRGGGVPTEMTSLYINLPLKFRGGVSNDDE